ncbi:hypothetical protein NFX46_27095 [Streptomyces phaeoluteigriseus]|uniref:Lipoprotein n=1 Tax=Streptomyces phaeoluteigriseus TaxID=114686 RepID=A0ABY4ZET1_9ACTN|nr:hypothetical protein [Streptomyces phaeoluteigriseus]USQ87063.1 hypothetical protein NFX46_27095 [Streptomyces phaeoluteigriseus]
MARVQRTTTTATLLVTVAVSALAGCVTVQHPPVPGPPAAPAHPSVPRADGRAGTQVVQAPAQEALEMVGPERGRDSKASAPPRRTAAPAPGQPPSAHSRPPGPAHPGPARPERRRPAQPFVEIPDVKEEVRGHTDVCTLGKKYGGWRAGSPEAVICEGTYGR